MIMILLKEKYIVFNNDLILIVKQNIFFFTIIRKHDHRLQQGLENKCKFRHQHE